MRLRDASTYLAISQKRIRALIRSGVLPKVRYSDLEDNGNVNTSKSPVLVDIADLDLLIEKSKVVTERI